MNFVFQKEKGEIDAWLADMDEAAMEQGIGEAAKALKVTNIFVKYHSLEYIYSLFKFCISSSQYLMCAPIFMKSSNFFVPFSYDRKKSPKPMQLQRLL